MLLASEAVKGMPRHCEFHLGLCSTYGKGASISLYVSATLVTSSESVFVLELVTLSSTSLWHSSAPIASLASTAFRLQRFLIFLQPRLIFVLFLSLSLSLSLSFSFSCMLLVAVPSARQPGARGSSFLLYGSRNLTGVLQ